MTIAELLALVGRAWSRLALYPGGLTLLAALWALARLERQTTQSPAVSGTPGMLALASAWLGVALLPAPLVTPLGRPPDIFILVALWEWPRLLAAQAEAQRGDTRRLAAMLNSYPLLVIGAALLAQATGSFEPGAWSVTPDPAQARALAGYWLGAGSLALSLPAVLGIGPFRAIAPRPALLRYAIQIRGFGFTALALLPWLAWAGNLSPWLMPVPAAVLAGVLWLFDRSASRFGALPWARASFWLALALLAAMLMLSAGNLAERLL